MKHKIIQILFICIAALLVLTGGLFTYAWLAPYGKVVTEDGDVSYARLGMKVDLLFDMINSNSELTQVSDGTNLGIESTDYDVSTGYSTDTVGSMTRFYKVIDKKKRYVYGIENYGTENETCYYLYDSNASWGTANNPYIISNVKHVQNLSILQEIGYFYELYVAEYYKEGTFTFNGEDCMPYFLVCEPDGTPVTVAGEGIKFSPIGTDEFPFIGYVGGAFTEGITTVDGKECDQSVIRDINIQTSEDLVDVGFFGAIGYLKNLNAQPLGDGSFEGYVSTVQDFLLYDVTITVENDSIVDILGKFASHLFSFTKTEGVAANPYTVPHENHHFGILAGHVEYATVKYISVYYSDANTNAIDITHVVTSGTMKANYYTVCGIIGYIDHMNADRGDGLVDNNGVSNEEVAVTTGGVGTGGGLESGEGRGYVTAYEIMDAYNDSGQIMKWKVVTTGTNPDGSAYSITNYKYGLCVQKNSEPLTVQTSSGTVSTYYSLSDGTTPVVLASDCSKVTTYSTYRNFVGITRVNEETWNDFIVYDKTLTGEEQYYFYVGITPVSVKNSDTETTGISLRYAAKLDTDTETFTRLCVQYERNRIGSSITGWTQPTDRYYFYDGVFTFSLSDPSDSIETTWKAQVDGEGEPVADSFKIGNTDPAEWETNTTTGNKATVAYMKQMTTMQELKSAAVAGKQIFIAYGLDTSNRFLVTLADNSGFYELNGDDSLFTKGTQLSLADEDTRASLKTSLRTYLQTGAASPVSGITKENIDEVWDDYQILNVGNSLDDKKSLDVLKTYYNIDVAFHEKEEETTYKDEYGNDFVTGGNITVKPGEGIIESGLTHTWDAFLAAETTDLRTGFLVFYAKYNYFYVKKGNYKGSAKMTSGEFSSSSSGWKAPTAISGITKERTEYGVDVYSFTVSGTKYEGPMLFLQGGNFYKSWSRNYSSQVTIGSGTAVTSEPTSTYVSTYEVLHNYFTVDITDTGSVYHYNGSGSALTSAPVPAMSPDGATEKKVTINNTEYRLYTDGTHEGILLSRNAVSGSYTFGRVRGGVQYYLRILRRNYLLSNRYSILCASDDYAGNGSNFIVYGVTPTVDDDEFATVNANGDGTFTITYEINGQPYKLAYTNNPPSAAAAEYPQCFHGTTGTDYTKMYLYTVEGTQDVDYGYVTYDPKGAEGTEWMEFDASQYVLWPNEETDLSEYNGGTTPDVSYSVKQLGVGELSAGNGWKDAAGRSLYYENLQNVFSLGQGISDINLVSIWGGDSGLDESSYVRAPIGTTGEEAYIPTGCVAFRVNKESPNNKVRVIVAVPVSNDFYGKKDKSGEFVNSSIDYQDDYYFCIWKISSAGSAILNSIKLSNCEAAFEIPRSVVYEPGTKASDGDYYQPIAGYSGSVADGNSVAKYVTVTDGDAEGTEYRSYLNGKEVLVAYEFEAEEEGVYLLGSTKECRIVYFSADSTASSGRDGTTSYKLGSIDFVYSYNGPIYSGTTSQGGNINKIVTVKQVSPVSDLDEIYYYYYPSLCLFNTSNGATPVYGDTDTQEYQVNVTSNKTYYYPNINVFQIQCRREINNDHIDFTYRVGAGKEVANLSDEKYILFVRYSLDADTLVQTNVDN